MQMPTDLQSERNDVRNIPRRRMGVSCVWQLLLFVFVFTNGLLLRAAVTSPQPASSEFRMQSNGLWLFVDGRRMPAFAGAVYQNTAGDMHIRAYSNSLHSLYSGLD